MSPLSTVLPPPNPVWVQDFLWPTPWNNSRPGQTGNVTPFSRHGGQRPAGMSDGPTVSRSNSSNSFALGVATNILPAFRTYRGRFCVDYRSGSATAATGACYVVPGWQPTYEATGQASGSRTNEESVVGIVDLHIALQLAGATPAWANDRAGIVWYPVSANPWNVSGAPGNGGTVGGFGVFFNTVGGVLAAEYLSFNPDGGPYEIERVSVPVADLSDWNLFRFQIIGAAAGRAATVELIVNGSSVLTRTFGSPQLLTPSQAAPGTPKLGSFYAPGVAAFGPNSSDRIFLTTYARFGRFTASASEVQAP